MQLPEDMNTQEYQRWLDLETHLRMVKPPWEQSRMWQELDEIFHEKSLGG